MVVDVITGYRVMGTHARRIDLEHFANDFCRSYRDEAKRRLSISCLALCQRRKKYMSIYNMDDLEELLRIDIGSLNRFIRSSEWFRD